MYPRYDRVAIRHNLLTGSSGTRKEARAAETAGVLGSRFCSVVLLVCSVAAIVGFRRY